MSDEPAIDDLRDRLQAVMEENGFTQTDVSKTIGLSQSSISKFLRGESKSPPPDTLNRIRAFLGDDEHEAILSHEEVRKAVRLYRYMKKVQEEGSKVIVRTKDGDDQIIVFLW